MNRTAPRRRFTHGPAVQRRVHGLQGPRHGDPFWRLAELWLEDGG